ncbi:MAG: hypothetical protein AAGA68_16395 [Pseudomonadota bacterium]
MTSRPDITVVIRTEGLLLRADQGSEARPVQRWRRSWPDLPAALTHALSDGAGPVGRRVWVLDSGVWFGAIELSSGAVAGLSDKDLIEPAAYEAEALSDIKPADAVTEVQRRRMADLGDSFLVAQVKRSDMIAVTKAVRGARSRLAGISHPAGLAEALAPASPAIMEPDGSWRRLEFWSDSVVLVECVAGAVTLIPLGAVPQSDWRRALAPYLRGAEPVGQEQTLIEGAVKVRGGHQWRETTSPDNSAARWLAEDGVDDEDTGLPTWRLGDDDAATQFAAAWARCLAAEGASRTEGGPVLRPPSAQTERWTAVAVGVVVFLLALSTVLLQRSQGQEQYTVLQAQLDHAQGQQQVVTDRRARLRTLSSEVRSRERAVQALEQELDRFSRDWRTTAGVDRRVALAALMEAVGQLVDEDIVIRSLEHRMPWQSISGVASTPEAASRLASNLSRMLSTHWRVNPAQIEPKAGSGGVVWEFSILMEPVVDLRAPSREARR